MNPLKNIRIKNKIIIIIVLIGALSTFTGSFINYLYEVQKSKEQLVSNTMLQARLISEYCGLPLEFNYPDNAADALEKLRSIPDIQDGILFTADDSVFASYHRTGNAVTAMPEALEHKDNIFEGDYIHVRQPVFYKGTPYGTIYLRSFIHWESFIARRLVVTLAIIGIMLIIIFALASVLHRNISEPIVELTGKMNAVARNKDYSVEFNTSGSDEIGELYMGFDSMLREIKKRESEMKALLESLRLSEEQFRATFDQAAVGIAHSALDGKWLRVNNRLCEIVGYTRDELLSRSFQDITHPDDLDVDLANLNRLVRNDAETYAREKRYVRKDGSAVWVYLTVSLLRGADGDPKYLIAVTEDITARKHAEKEQKIMAEHLVRAQRTESIGTLAAGIAHDFNNILNVIMGNAELLGTMPATDEKFSRRISAITTAADRGSHVVRQLLSFARKADIQHLPMDVNDILADLSKLLEETFPKTIVIVNELTPCLPSVIGDSNQIHQVLLNLSVNARDAMPGGGTLIFATTVVDGVALADQYPSAEPVPYVSIIVRDTGTGMDAATRSRIFDPFFTTKEKGKGTGLGLAVAIGIIESHRGFIDVKSAVGTGTEFDIHLPAVTLDDRIIEPAGGPRVAAAGGSETILFIEDEPLIRELIVPVLRENGYTVITAVDGEEGIRLYERHHGEIGLVLSDHGLPKYDGEEVFRRVKEINPNAVFVIVTGFMEPEKRTALAIIGVAATLSKPYKPADLLCMIRELLD